MVFIDSHGEVQNMISLILKQTFRESFGWGAPPEPFRVGVQAGR